MDKNPFKTNQPNFYNSISSKPRPMSGYNNNKSQSFNPSTLPRSFSATKKSTFSRYPKNINSTNDRGLFASTYQGRNSLSMSHNKNQPQPNFTSTAIENERKAFERMKQKNQMELIGMVQFELERELLRKKAEEKLEEQKERNERFQRELIKKRKKEEEEKREKDRQREEHQKQIEMEQKRLEKERYELNIKKAKEEAIKERQRLKEQKEKHIEEEKRRKEFQDKINSIQEEKRRVVLERQRFLDEKERERQVQKIRREKELKEVNEEKSKAQKEKFESVLRGQEMERTKIRNSYLEKQKKNEEKKKRFEYNKFLESEQKKAEAIKKQEEINKILENNKNIQQKKLDDYNEKQKQIEIKKQEMDRQIMKENEAKMLLIEQKNKKMREILDKNEVMLNERKEKILFKIKQNEENILHVRHEKDLLNQQIMNENAEKRIERENNIRRVDEEKCHHRQEILNEINYKKQKVEDFQRQKELLAQEKRNIQSEIATKRQEYAEKFSKIFSKKTIDQKTLKSIQEMFPENQEISNLVNNFRLRNNSSYQKSRASYGQNKLTYNASTSAVVSRDKDIGNFSKYNQFAATAPQNNNNYTMNMSLKSGNSLFKNKAVAPNSDIKSSNSYYAFDKSSNKSNDHPKSIFILKGGNDSGGYNKNVNDRGGNLSENRNNFQGYNEQYNSDGTYRKNGENYKAQINNNLLELLNKEKLKVSNQGEGSGVKKKKEKIGDIY